MLLSTRLCVNAVITGVIGLLERAPVRLRTIAFELVSDCRFVRMRCGQFPFRKNKKKDDFIDIAPFKHKWSKVVWLVDMGQ